MEFKKVWSGKLPPYWDVTPWHCLTDKYIALCFRELTSRRRVLQVIDLHEQGSYILDTIFNLILGGQGTNLYLGRITDRRTHADISRVSKYDIMNRSVLWSLDDTFLVEKHKIPFISQNSTNFSLGNHTIDLSTGETIRYKNNRSQYWILNSNTRLVQHDVALCCLDSNDKTLWTKENVYGNWYQGVKSNSLFLRIPNDRLVLVDVHTGQELETIDLIDLKRVNNRLTGSLDVRNDDSYHSSTIFEMLINDGFVVWINNENELVVYNRSSRNLTKKPYQNSGELFVSNINNRGVLIYGMQDEEYSELLYVDLEGM